MVRVFNHYLPVNYIFLVAVETLILLVSIYLGVSLWSPEQGVVLARSLDALWPKSMVFAGVMIMAMTAVGLYRDQGELREGFRGIIQRLGVGFLLGFAIMSLIFHAVPELFVARGAFGIAFLSAIAGIALTRIGFVKWADMGLLRPRVLVLGTGSRALKIETALRAARKDRDLDIVGFVQLPTEGEAFHPKVLDEAGTLLDVARRHRVSEIVIGVRDRRGGALPIQELLECKLHGIRVTELASFYERECGQVRLDSLNPSWMILNEGFRNNATRDAVKRVFDVAVSALILALTLPVMVVTALLIKLESAGPVLYRQERVGRGGRTFEVLKFRSMRADAERDGRPRWASANDDRVTRVGRVIRKLRIDELPQVFNVLRGDMSFVGPRPERPFFVEQLAAEIPYYYARHTINPGITGWAQVRYPYGASVEDSIEKLQYDLYYLKNHSIFLDLMVLVETVQVVLWGKGAR